MPSPELQRAIDSFDYRSYLKMNGLSDEEIPETLTPETKQKLYARAYSEYVRNEINQLRKETPGGMSPKAAFKEVEERELEAKPYLRSLYGYWDEELSADDVYKPEMLFPVLKEKYGIDVTDPNFDVEKLGDKANIPVSEVVKHYSSQIINDKTRRNVPELEGMKRPGFIKQFQENNGILNGDTIGAFLSEYRKQAAEDAIRQDMDERSTMQWLKDVGSMAVIQGKEMLWGSMPDLFTWVAQGARIPYTNYRPLSGASPYTVEGDTWANKKLVDLMVWSGRKHRQAQEEAEKENFRPRYIESPIEYFRRGEYGKLTGSTMEQLILNGASTVQNVLTPLTITFGNKIITPVTGTVGGIIGGVGGGLVGVVGGPGGIVAGAGAGAAGGARTGAALGKAATIATVGGLMAAGALMTASDVVADLHELGIHDPAKVDKYVEHIATAVALDWTSTIIEAGLMGGGKLIGVPFKNRSAIAAEKATQQAAARANGLDVDVISRLAGKQLLRNQALQRQANSRIWQKALRGSGAWRVMRRGVLGAAEEGGSETHQEAINMDLVNKMTSTDQEGNWSPGGIYETINPWAWKQANREGGYQFPEKMVKHRLETAGFVGAVMGGGMVTGGTAIQEWNAAKKRVKEDEKLTVTDKNGNTYIVQQAMGQRSEATRVFQDMVAKGQNINAQTIVGVGLNQTGGVSVANFNGVTGTGISANEAFIDLSRRANAGRQNIDEKTLTAVTGGHEVTLANGEKLTFLGANSEQNLRDLVTLHNSDNHPLVVNGGATIEYDPANKKPYLITRTNGTKVRAETLYDNYALYDFSTHADSGLIMDTILRRTSSQSAEVNIGLNITQTGAFNFTNSEQAIRDSINNSNGRLILLDPAKTKKGSRARVRKDGSLKSDTMMVLDAEDGVIYTIKLKGGKNNSNAHVNVTARDLGGKKLTLDPNVARQTIRSAADPAALRNQIRLKSPKAGITIQSEQVAGQTQWNFKVGQIEEIARLTGATVVSPISSANNYVEFVVPGFRRTTDGKMEEFPTSFALRIDDNGKVWADTMGQSIEIEGINEYTQLVPGDTNLYAHALQGGKYTTASIDQNTGAITMRRTAASGAEVELVLGRRGNIESYRIVSNPQREQDMIDTAVAERSAMTPPQQTSQQQMGQIVDPDLTSYTSQEIAAAGFDPLTINETLRTTLQGNIASIFWGPLFSFNAIRDALTTQFGLPMDRFMVQQHIGETGIVNGWSIRNINGEEIAFFNNDTQGLRDFKAFITEDVINDMFALDKLTPYLLEQAMQKGTTNLTSTEYKNAIEKFLNYYDAVFAPRTDTSQMIPSNERSARIEKSLRIFIDELEAGRVVLPNIAAVRVLYDDLIENGYGIWDPNTRKFAVDSNGKRVFNTNRGRLLNIITPWSYAGSVPQPLYKLGNEFYSEDELVSAAREQKNLDLLTDDVIKDIVDKRVQGMQERPLDVVTRGNRRYIDILNNIIFQEVRRLLDPQYNNINELRNYYGNNLTKRKTWRRMDNGEYKYIGKDDNLYTETQVIQDPRIRELVTFDENQQPHQSHIWLGGNLYSEIYQLKDNFGATLWYQETPIRNHKGKKVPQVNYDIAINRMVQRLRMVDILMMYHNNYDTNDLINDTIINEDNEPEFPAPVRSDIEAQIQQELEDAVLNAGTIMDFFEIYGHQLQQRFAIIDSSNNLLAGRTGNSTYLGVDTFLTREEVADYINKNGLSPTQTVEAYYVFYNNDLSAIESFNTMAQVDSFINDLRRPEKIAAIDITERVDERMQAEEARVAQQNARQEALRNQRAAVAAGAQQQAATGGKPTPASAPVNYADYLTRLFGADSFVSLNSKIELYQGGLNTQHSLTLVESTYANENLYGPDGENTRDLTNSERTLDKELEMTVGKLWRDAKRNNLIVVHKTVADFLALFPNERQRLLEEIFRPRVGIQLKKPRTQVTRAEIQAEIANYTQDEQDELINKHRAVQGYYDTVNKKIHLVEETIPWTMADRVFYHELAVHCSIHLTQQISDRWVNIAKYLKKHRNDKTELGRAIRAIERNRKEELRLHKPDTWGYWEEVCAYFVADNLNKIGLAARIKAVFRDWFRVTGVINKKGDITSADIIRFARASANVAVSRSSELKNANQSGMTSTTAFSMMASSFHTDFNTVQQQYETVEQHYDTVQYGDAFGMVYDKTTGIFNESNLNGIHWSFVRTPIFKKWFGDWETKGFKASKIVDTNGEPLLVFHNTKYDHEAYDAPFVGLNGNFGHSGKSIYSNMTENPYAEKFRGNMVAQTFINMRKPLHMHNYEETARYMEALGYEESARKLDLGKLLGSVREDDWVKAVLAGIEEYAADPEPSTSFADFMLLNDNLILSAVPLTNMEEAHRFLNGLFEAATTPGNSTLTNEPVLNANTIEEWLETLEDDETRAHWQQAADIFETRLKPYENQMLRLAYNPDGYFTHYQQAHEDLSISTRERIKDVLSAVDHRYYGFGEQDMIDFRQALMDTYIEMSQLPESSLTNDELFVGMVNMSMHNLRMDELNWRLGEDLDFVTTPAYPVPTAQSLLKEHNREFATKLKSAMIRDGYDGILGTEDILVMHPDQSKDVLEFKRLYQEKSYNPTLGLTENPIENRVVEALNDDIKRDAKVLGVSVVRLRSEYRSVYRAFREQNPWNESNLDEYQWILTRTPSFKENFGDWQNDATPDMLLDTNAEPLRTARGFIHGTGTVDVGGSNYFSMMSAEGMISREMIISEDEQVEAQAQYDAIVAQYRNPDGTMKEGWMKAPNGADTHLTERQWVQVRTPNFKRWFGDWENDPENASRVVDENGEPRVMYHMSNSEFEAFRKGRKGGKSGNGIYFSPTPKKQYGSVEYGVFLNLRNPMTKQNAPEEVLEKEGPFVLNIKTEAFDEHIEFDGVMYFPVETTVRNPNQIKSATENTGTFSGEQENMYFSMMPYNRVQNRRELEQPQVSFEQDESQTSTIPRGRQKQAGVEYPDFTKEQVTGYFSLSKRTREEAIAQMRKPREGRPDLTEEQMNVILDELDKYDKRKKQLLTLKWILNGSIAMPIRGEKYEDGPLVDEAIRLAEKMKVDPFAFDNPAKILNEYKELHPESVLLKPEDIPQFSDPRDEGDGIISYEVEDTKEGQQAVRNIINSHWGKNWSNWCLTRANAQGELQQPEAWKMWEMYNGLPKRVAFKNGKFVSIMATRKPDEYILDNSLGTANRRIYIADVEDNTTVTVLKEKYGLTDEEINVLRRNRLLNNALEEFRHATYRMRDYLENDVRVPDRYLLEMIRFIKAHLTLVDDLNINIFSNPHIPNEIKNALLDIKNYEMNREGERRGENGHYLVSKEDIEIYNSYFNKEYPYKNFNFNISGKILWDEFFTRYVELLETEMKRLNDIIKQTPIFVPQKIDESTIKIVMRDGREAPLEDLDGGQYLFRWSEPHNTYISIPTITEFWWDQNNTEHSNLDWARSTQEPGSQGMFSMFGPQGAERFLGTDEYLQVAENMRQMGIKPKIIKYATGYEWSDDQKKWEYEVSNIEHNIIPAGIDSFIQSIRELYTNVKSRGTKLSSVEEEFLNTTKPKRKSLGRPFAMLSEIFSAPEIYLAYPDAADIDVMDGPFLKSPAAYHSSGTIFVHPFHLLESHAKIRDSILHEVQHYIQDVEGFLHTGATRNRNINGPITNDREYWYNPGEVEARQVVLRSGLTQDQIRNTLFDEILFEDGTIERIDRGYYSMVSRQMQTSVSSEETQREFEETKGYFSAISDFNPFTYAVLKSYEKDPALEPTAMIGEGQTLYDIIDDKNIEFVKAYIARQFLSMNKLNINDIPSELVEFYKDSDFYLRKFRGSSILNIQSAKEMKAILKPLIDLIESNESLINKFSNQNSSKYNKLMDDFFKPFMKVWETTSLAKAIDKRVHSIKKVGNMDELREVLMPLAIGWKNSLRRVTVKPSYQNIRHTIAEIAAEHPATMEDICRSTSVEYKRDPSEYTEEDIRKLTPNIVEYLQNQRDDLFVQWNSILRDQFGSRYEYHYLVWRSFYKHFGKGNTFALPIAPDSDIVQSDLFVEYEKQWRKNPDFYKFYTESVISNVKKRSDRIIPILDAEGNHIRTWIKISVSSENQADIDQAMSDIRAASLGTTWCTKQGGERRIIETDKHDFWVLYDEGKKKSVLALVPVREGQEDQIKGNNYYTGIFNGDDNFHNDVPVPLIEDVRKLYTETKGIDKDVTRTLDLLKDKWMTPEEQAKLLQEKFDAISRYIEENNTSSTFFELLKEVTDLSLYMNRDNMLSIEYFRSPDNIPQEYEKKIMDYLSKNLEVIEGLYKIPDGTTLEKLKIINDVSFDIGNDVNLPSLEYVDGTVDVGNNVNLPSLKIVNGSFQVGDNVNVSSLEKVNGIIYINDTTKVNSDFRKLVQAQKNIRGLKQITDEYFEDFERVTGIKFYRDSEGYITTKSKNPSSDEWYSDIFKDTIERIQDNFRTNDDYPNLKRVDGNLSVRSDIKLPSLRIVSGNLQISNDVNLPSLRVVGGAIHIFGDRINLSNLSHVHGEIHINLENANNLNINQNVRTNISLEELNSVINEVESSSTLDEFESITDEYFEIFRNVSGIELYRDSDGYIATRSNFNRIDAEDKFIKVAKRSVERVKFNIYEYDETDFPNLKILDGDLITKSPNLPLLEKVNGDVTIGSDGELSATLPNLKIIDGELTTTGNANLPSLRLISGNINLWSNGLDLPNLSYIGGEIDWGVGISRVENRININPNVEFITDKDTMSNLISTLSSSLSRFSSEQTQTSRSRLSPDNLPPQTSPGDNGYFSMMPPINATNYGTDIYDRTEIVGSNGAYKLKNGKIFIDVNEVGQENVARILLYALVRENQAALTNPIMGRMLSHIRAWEHSQDPRLRGLYADIRMDIMNAGVPDTALLAYAVRRMMADGVNPTNPGAEDTPEGVFAAIIGEVPNIIGQVGGVSTGQVNALTSDIVTVVNAISGVENVPIEVAVPSMNLTEAEMQAAYTKPVPLMDAIMQEVKEIIDRYDGASFDYINGKPHLILGGQGGMVLNLSENPLFAKNVVDQIMEKLTDFGNFDTMTTDPNAKPGDPGNPFTEIINKIGTNSQLGTQATEADVNKFINDNLPAYIADRIQVVYNETPEFEALFGDQYGALYRPLTADRKVIFVRAYGRNLSDVIGSIVNMTSYFGWTQYNNADFAPLMDELWTVLKHNIQTDLPTYYAKLNGQTPNISQKSALISAYLAAKSTSIYELAEFAKTSNVAPADEQKMKDIAKKVKDEITKVELSMAASFARDFGVNKEAVHEYTEKLLRMTMAPFYGKGMWFAYDVDYDTYHANNPNTADKYKDFGHVMVFANDFGPVYKPIPFSDDMLTNRMMLQKYRQVKPVWKKFHLFLWRNWHPPMKHIGDTILGLENTIMLNRAYKSVTTEWGSALKNIVNENQAFRDALIRKGIDTEEFDRAKGYVQELKDRGITDRKLLEQAEVLDVFLRVGRQKMLSNITAIRASIRESAMEAERWMRHENVPEKEIQKMHAEMDRFASRFVTDWEHRSYRAYMEEDQNNLQEMWNILDGWSPSSMPNGSVWFSNTVRKAQQDLTQLEQDKARGVIAEQVYAERRKELKKTLKMYERLDGLYHWTNQNVMASLPKPGSPNYQQAAADVPRKVNQQMKQEIENVMTLVSAEKARGNLGKMDLIPAVRKRRLNENNPHDVLYMTFLDKVKDPAMAMAYNLDQQGKVLDKLVFNLKLGRSILETGMGTIKGSREHVNLGVDNLSWMETGTLLRYIKVDPFFLDEIRHEQEIQLNLHDTVWGGFINIIKQNFTILNWRMMVSNYLGNVSNLIATGHFFRFKNWMAGHAVGRDKFHSLFTQNPKEAVNSLSGKKGVANVQQAMRDYEGTIAEYKEEMEKLNIWGSSTTTIDLTRYGHGGIEKVSQLVSGILESTGVIDEVGSRSWNRRMNRVMNMARELYGFGDEWVKTLTYINNRAVAIAKYRAQENWAQYAGNEDSEAAVAAHKRIMEMARREAAMLTMKETTTWELSPDFARQISASPIRVISPDFLLHGFQMARIMAVNVGRTRECAEEIARLRLKPSLTEDERLYLGLVTSELVRRTIGQAMMLWAGAEAANYGGSALMGMVGSVIAFFRGEGDDDDERKKRKSRKKDDPAQMSPADHTALSMLCNYVSQVSDLYTPLMWVPGAVGDKFYATNFQRLNAALTFLPVRPAKMNPSIWDRMEHMLWQLIDLRSDTLSVQVANTLKGKDRYGRDLTKSEILGEMVNYVTPQGLHQARNVALGIKDMVLGTEDIGWEERKKNRPLNIFDVAGVKVRQYSVNDMIEQVGRRISNLEREQDNPYKRKFFQKLQRNLDMSDADIATAVADIISVNKTEMERIAYAMEAFRLLNIDRETLIKGLTRGRERNTQNLGNKETALLLAGRDVLTERLKTNLQTKMKALQNPVEGATMTDTERRKIMDNYRRAHRMISEALR